ncbi:MAG: DUF262 domain-containing protein [Cryomorphaceae bacterium]|nr:DUF262 domain-containing protein [Cryomorphaceae bacterium]
MAELIYSVERVFGDYLKDNQFYNIPEYQRGYKWTDKQINQLLDDIKEFETGDDEDLFYCLQNITLVLNAENKLNVVDGQQRLTTIALLLAYLDESERVKSKLVYSVRKPSNEFIQHVISNNDSFLTNIVATNDFDAFLSETESNGNDYDYQDIYFMYQAIHTIDNWFDDNESIVKTAFKEKLLKNVKLIVNRIENTKEQELFMNLNAGKVQLDGSDLVRAILITRVAKQEMEEFDSTEVKDVVRLNERRIRIGWELDELNAWWSKDNVLEYFSNLTNLKTGEKETIKFEQGKHPINQLYKIWAESKGENEIKLGLFETKNTNALDLYVSIILLHRTLKDWYEDREIYHYLGFLFSQKSISFNEVWNEWNEENRTRDQFILFLKTELKNCVFGKESTNESEDTGIQFWLDKIKDYDTENPTNWYETSQLEKILLLLDFIDHSKKKENGIPLPFLKPKYFKNFREDKEHIYPGTPTQFKDFKKQSASVLGIKNYIKELNKGYEADNKIKWSCSEIEWDEFSEEEKNNKLSELKEQIHQKRPINSIGNLVLLHLSINRGFGNNYYADKRITVINNTENGEYVRHHTLKVFVKQTDNEDISSWTMQDIRNNADKIHNTVKTFFNFNNEVEQ